MLLKFDFLLLRLRIKLFFKNFRLTNPGLKIKY
jgi:hypothetical protein